MDVTFSPPSPSSSSSSCLDTTARATRNDACSSNYSATFSGRLDTQTLGGAGFTSRATYSCKDGKGGKKMWDLEGYEGLEVHVLSSSSSARGGGDGGGDNGKGEGKNKRYTLILKDDRDDLGDGDGNGDKDDEVIGRRDDKRGKAGVSWEWDFIGEGGKRVFGDWAAFRAMYRGKEVDVPPLKVGRIRRFSIMMRR